jgi:hypothetical protein
MLSSWVRLLSQGNNDEISRDIAKYRELFTQLSHSSLIKLKSYSHIQQLCIEIVFNNLGHLWKCCFQAVSEDLLSSSCVTNRFNRRYFYIQADHESSWQL